MKKTLLIAMLLILVSFSFAEIYTIGTGIDTQVYIPMYGLYEYGWSKTIYTAMDLNNVGLTNMASITAIGFDVGNDPINYSFVNQQLYVRNTTLNVQDSSYPNPTNYSLVYSGNPTFDGGGWYTFNFTTPFQWDGNSNLEFMWRNNNGSWSSGYPTFRYTSTTTNMSAYAYADGSLPTGTGNLTLNRPNIQIHAVQEFPDDPTLFIYPLSIDFGYLSYDTTSDAQMVRASNYGQGVLNLTAANFSITGTNADMFDFDASNLPVALEMGEYIEIPVTAGGTTVGAISANLVITYAGEDHVIPMTAHILPEGLVEIGDGTLTQRFPFGHLYGYERSAAVYTMDEIGTVGMIHSVSWHCSAAGNMSIPYKIYVGSTDSAQVPAQSFQTITSDLTLASEGFYTFSTAGWHTFELDTPVIYTGGNLIIAVENNYGGSGTGGYPYFYYTTSGTNSHAYWQQDNSMPTANGNLNALRPNIRLAMGDLTGDPQLMASPQSIHFGTVFNGAQVGPRNITLANIGGGSLTVSADELSLSGTHAAEFSFDASALPVTLESAQTVQIPVYVTGTTVGNISATLSIESNNQSLEIDLGANVLPAGTVVIGDGTSTQRYPFGQFFGHERSVSIYNFDEIMGVGIINSIGWDCATPRDVATIYKIYLGATTQTQVQSQTYDQAIADLTLVKEGSYTFSTTGWHMLDLDTPFVYTGSNLVVAVETNYGGSGSGSSTDPNFRYTIAGTNSHAYWLADQSPPTGTPSSLNTNRPNLQLVLADLTGDPQISVSPQAIDFGTVFNGAQVGPRNVMISNIGGGSLTVSADELSLSGTHATQFSFDASAFPVTLESAQTVIVPVYVTGTTEGNISATLSINSNNQAFVVSLNANVLPPGTVIVGDGVTAQRQPFGHVWGYERSAAVYTAQEIVGVGMLHQIGWYCNAGGSANMPYKIYVGTTPDNVLAPQTFSQLTANMSLVKEGTHHFTTTGWVMFPLDLPVPYTGDNLIIAVEINHGGSGGGTSPSFRYTSALQGSHLIWYADQNPPTTDGNQNTMRPNVMLSLAEMGGDPQLTAFPAALNFGEVANGTTSQAQYVTVANIGGGTVTITADDVSITGSHAATFSYATDVFPIVLESATTFQIPLYANSTMPGNATASFHIDWEGETFTTALSVSILPPGLVVIGTGSTDLKLPVNPFYGYSYTQQLYLQSEINMADKQIEQIAFYWNGAGVGNLTKDWVIWMGHTPLTSLSSYLPISQMTPVFDGEVLATATPGWVTIDLDVPFLYNNTDNLVIAVDENTPSYDGSSQFYYCTTTTANRALRYYNDSTNPEPSAPPAPTVLQGFPNIRMLLFDIPDSPMLTYNPYELDFGVISYDVQIGPLNVNVGNRGIGVLELNADDISFAGDHAEMFSFDDSAFPLSLASGVFAAIPVYVQSTQEGNISAHMIITYDGEEHIVQLSAQTMEQGLLVLQLGNGTTLNGDTGSPTPYGSWYRCFREQYLFRASEIFALGGAPGLINSIGWHVNTVGQCSPMPNYRIRIKHTTQNELTSSFEAGVYTQVFHHNSFLPVDGWNFHIFSEPFIWNGQDNIIIDIVTDQTVAGYTRNALVYNTSTPFNSSMRYQSDSGSGLDGTTGSVLSTRPNTRLFMLIDGMGSLSGNITEDGLPVKNVNVSIQGSVFTAQTNNNGYYSFPFAPVGDQNIIASKNGYTTVTQAVEIVEDETATLDFVMVGTPEFAFSEPSWNFGDVTIGGSNYKDFQILNAGGSSLTVESIEITGSGAFSITQMPTLPATLRTEDYITIRVNFAPALLGILEASIIVTDDQNNRHTLSSIPGVGLAINPQSNQELRSRDSHELVVTGNGVHSITIGAGNEEARLPLDFFWRNSMFQTIFTQDDLDGFIGFITGMKLYNNFTTEVMTTPVKVWLAGTTQTNLAAGWISSNEMTLVFDGLVNFPSGENIIPINFPDPFLFIDQENLLMLVQRPMDTQYFSSTNYFKCQTSGSDRTRYNYSDGTEFNPQAMTDGYTSGQFPKITFEVIPGGVGHIEGIVRGEDGSPLQGVAVNVDLRMSAITNQYGEFFIRNLLPNNYQVIFSRYGYLTQTVDIVIEEDQTIEMDIDMEEMPQVSILGMIIASDTGEGIEGANLAFTGYANYNVATNTAGEFIVDSNVYAYNTYDYVLTANGYTTQTGSVEIGPQDYDMGTITMDELAFAPTQVAATIAPDYGSVNISWNPPDPDAFEIVESFEGVAFPPTDWSQEITNNGPPNMYGVRPTWCKFGTAENVSPSDGGQQAGLAWVAEHQDEWLFTPSFTCPPDAYLRFDTHLEMGSEGGDHYYVKATNNGGVSWQVLWDGSAQPISINNYDTPIVVDLTQFGGQMIKLAWHADDGDDAFGMWYNWYIDNIYIGNFVRGEELNVFAESPALITSSQGTNTTRGISIDETNIQLNRKDPKHHNRALTGYKVWRLRSGQEEAENNWVSLTDEMLTETGFVDEGWQSLAEGQYVWAIKAIYTADVTSMPVFSNTLFKENTNGTISGFVRRSGNNQAIAGAIVSAGEYSATTMASGFYSISLPAGTHSVTASHADYHNLTHEDVIVVPGENTTLNFTMTHTSTEDVVEITVTALSANYPNPFNPETTISYDLKEAAQVRLDVFNLKGQLVKTLVNDQQASGRYNVIFTAQDSRGNKLSSGIYFYRLKAGDYTKTRKMMLME